MLRRSKREQLFLRHLITHYPQSLTNTSAFKREIIRTIASSLRHAQNTMFASTRATVSSSSSSSSLTFRRSHQKQTQINSSMFPQRPDSFRQKHNTTTRALFTGIVQGTATVTTFTPIQGDFARLTLAFPENALENLTIGASIAVDGTCLTVVEFDVKKSTAKSFDMIAETLRATNLGELKVSDTVNYERSTKFGEEIGGHVVSGHVHTTAEICVRGDREQSRGQVSSRDREIVKYILPKGFVAVDGCSLTVGEVDEKEGTFNVWLIPETIRATAFRVKNVGGSVNIEIESSTRAIVDTIERVYGKEGEGENRMIIICASHM